MCISAIIRLSPLARMHPTEKLVKTNLADDDNHVIHKTLQKLAVHWTYEKSSGIKANGIRKRSNKFLRSDAMREVDTI